MKNQTEISRREKVSKCVKTFTKKIIQEHSYLNVGLDAYVVSSILKIDRSNASKELNDLWRAGQLIKIAGRPILYLDHEEFVQAYPMKYIPTFIQKDQQLTDYLELNDIETKLNYTHQNNLEQMIGCNASLFMQIQNAKAALFYPPYGLSCLIQGKIGVGKLQFAHDMFEYAIDKNIFDKTANFIIVNCIDYSTTPMLLLNQLVGSVKNQTDKKKKGLFESANGGMIYFDGIEKLNGKGLEILLNMMNKNTYTKLGDNTLRNIECMLVASTIESPTSEILTPFISHIPVFIPLPNINDRTLDEKMELILSYFSIEAKKIKKSIRLHRDILACFALAEYPGNLAQMRSEIIMTCCKAHLTHLQQNSSIVQIHHHHLSNEINMEIYPQHMTVKIHELLSNYPNDYILFDDKGECSIQYSIKSPNNTFSQDDWLDEKDSKVALSDYVQNRLNTLQTLNDKQFSMLQTLVNPSTKEYVYNILINEKIYTPLLENKFLFYGLLLHISNTLKRLEHNSKRASLSNDLHEFYPYEYDLANRIYTSCTYLSPLSVPKTEVENLMQYLVLTRAWLSKSTINLLVVAHGQHIASEMVEIACNQAHRCQIEAINFSSTMSMDTLLNDVYQKAKQLDQGSGILIISDIEPLCSLHTVLNEKTNIKSQTIYPLSLPLLSRLIKQCDNHNATLESLVHPIDQEPLQQKENYLTNNSFIQKLTDEILSSTLTFINPHKAVDALMISLNKILDDLKIENSDEIIVKFISHCTSMLERVISKDVLSYDRLKAFTSVHAPLIQVIENSFRYVDETFGVSIPPSELAYISEIFLPFIS